MSSTTYVSGVSGTPPPRPPPAPRSPGPQLSVPPGQPAPHSDAGTQLQDHQGGTRIMITDADPYHPRSRKVDQSPRRTNDLDPWRLVCSARPGPMVPG